MDKVKIIKDILDSKAGKAIAMPLATQLGDDLLSVYRILIRSPFDPNSSDFSDFFVAHYKNTFKKLLNKSFGKFKNIQLPPTDLTLKIIDQIKHEVLDNSVVSEVLLEILASTMNKDNKDDFSDYNKYIHIIKSLYPNALKLLYEFSIHTVYTEATHTYQIQN